MISNDFKKTSCKIDDKIITPSAIVKIGGAWIQSKMIPWIQEKIETLGLSAPCEVLNNVAPKYERIPDGWIMDNGKIGTAIPKPIEKNKSLNLILFKRLFTLKLIGLALSNSDSNKKINPTTKSSETLHP